MTNAELAADFSAAVDLAIRDSRVQDNSSRWLKELLAMAPDQIRRYPDEASTFRSAVKRGQKELARKDRELTRLAADWEAKQEQLERDTYYEDQGDI
jgi:hypothetical protein